MNSGTNGNLRSLLPFYRRARNEMMSQTYPDPGTTSERKAIRNFFKCIEEGSSELECVICPYPDNLSDFIALYRRAGAGTIVFTDLNRRIGTATLLKMLYALGCEWDAKCIVTRRNGITVEGARFRL